MRLIDADALLEADPEVCDDYGLEYGIECGYSREQIFNAHTVDAVDVCRCAECKHSKGACIDLWGEPAIECITGQTHSMDWFCADGERKGGNLR